LLVGSDWLAVFQFCSSCFYDGRLGVDRARFVVYFAGNFPFLYWVENEESMVFKLLWTSATSKPLRASSVGVFL